jgi:hypothetical protein
MKQPALMPNLLVMTLNMETLRQVMDHDFIGEAFSAFEEEKCIDDCRH